MRAQPSLLGTYKYALFMFVNNFIPKTLKCHNFYIRFRIETIHISLESSRRDLSDGIPLERYRQRNPPYRAHTNMHMFLPIKNFIPKPLKCHNFYIRFYIETIHISLELSQRDHCDGIPLGKYYQRNRSNRADTNMHILCLSINSYQNL